MSNHSPELDQLAAALVQVQAALPAARTDATACVGRPGATTSYRYATLNSVWEAVREILAANGLAVSQTCALGEAGEVRLTTWLLHTSGQWLRGTACLPLPWRHPRAYGSALTFARRYSLAGIIGLCVEADDDAAAVAGSPDVAEHRETRGEGWLEVDGRGEWMQESGARWTGGDGHRRRAPRKGPPGTPAPE
jgi:hypothetical protein